MPKSYISAIDFFTEQAIAAISTTLDGIPFSVLPPYQEHMHLALLAVRMTMKGNFEAEKEHVLGEMQRWMESLNANEVTAPFLKERPSRSALS